MTMGNAQRNQSGKAIITESDRWTDKADKATLAESGRLAVSAEKALLTGGGLGIIFKRYALLSLEKQKLAIRGLLGAF